MIFFSLNQTKPIKVICSVESLFLNGIRNIEKNFLHFCFQDGEECIPDQFRNLHVIFIFIQFLILFVIFNLCQFFQRSFLFLLIALMMVERSNKSTEHCVLQIHEYISKIVVFYEYLHIGIALIPVMQSSNRTNKFMFPLGKVSSD